MVGFFIQLTDAAIARDVRLEKQRNVDKKNFRCSVVALDHRRKKIMKKLLRVHTRYVALINATAVKNNLATVYKKEKIQRPGTIFFNFSGTAVAVLTGHQNCCRVATLL